MHLLCVVGLALIIAVSSGAARAATTVIHAGHLIAEPGKPVLQRQSIVIENGKIVALQSGFVPGDVVIDLKDAYVLPGLIDMHTHLTATVTGKDGFDPTKIAANYYGRAAASVLRAIPVARAVLMNGFTTIRNLGDPTSTTYDLRDAIAKGVVDGPRLLAVEPQFQVPGGDYQPSRFGSRRELEFIFENRGTCTGVDDCRRAVREEVARGADIIKFREGGLPYIDAKVGSIEYFDEVKAIVQTAHKLNRTVAAHVNGTPEGNRLAIEAGVDTIEHGPLDDQAIELMRKHGTAYTPTLMAMRRAKEQMKRMGVGRPGFDPHAQAVNSVAKAHRAGVMITFGSDMGPIPAESVPEEFAELVAAGLPPEQALRAATINAAVKLGMGDRLGSIAPGKTADVIAVPGDPLADIKQMSKVNFVMKGGRVFKKPQDASSAVASDGNRLDPTP